MAEADPVDGEESVGTGGFADDTRTGLGALQRLWADVEAGTEPVFAHSDVREWLSTWGKSEFKPWWSSNR